MHISPAHFSSRDPFGGGLNFPAGGGALAGNAGARATGAVPQETGLNARVFVFGMQAEHFLAGNGAHEAEQLRNISVGQTSGKRAHSGLESNGAPPPRIS